MALEKEFKVNHYITLKLENKTTRMYIKDKPFLHCKYLLLNISLDNTKDLEDIDAIDDAIEILDQSLEGKKPTEFKISPETEFWGHCSNLQAWVEQNYDVRLIHSNLAFPLLRKLVEVGDPIAKRVLKEEVVLRFINGNVSVKIYLLKQGYFNSFTKEEFEVLTHQLDFNSLPIWLIEELIPIAKNKGINLEFKEKIFDPIKFIISLF